MSGNAMATRVAVTVVALGAVTTAASAADFDWKKFQATQNGAGIQVKTMFEKGAA